jgi:hypothetical protein
MEIDKVRNFFFCLVLLGHPFQVNILREYLVPRFANAREKETLNLPSRKVFAITSPAVGGSYLIVAGERFGLFKVYVR